MTDNDIIKALGCCEEYECKGDCPLINNPHCLQVLKNNAFDLIKRQQAEIKHLREATKMIKAEAYKEFAERLNKNFETYTDDEEKNALYMRNLINNLVKELTGGNENA